MVEVQSDENAPDPTGGTPEQLAAKAAATALGDQDAENLAGAANDAAPDPLPAPTAELVRRHPDWYGDGVKRDFGLIGGDSANESTDDEADEDTDDGDDTDNGAPLTDAESSSSTSATIRAE